MDRTNEAAAKGHFGQRFSAVLLLAGMAWLGYLMVGHVDSFTDVLPDSWLSFLSSLVLLSLSVALPGFVFLFLLDHYHKGRNSWTASFNLYFAGQLLKYIPGKIWGIVYQVSRSDEISALSIARVNVDQTLFITLINVIFAVFILGIKDVVPSLLAFAIVAIGIVTVSVYMLGGSQSILQVIRRFVPRLAAESIDAECSESLSWKAVLGLTTIQLVSVALFAVSWHVLADGYLDLKGLDFLVLGMIYVIASAIGIVTMVTPAGLGVREASFVTLASSLASVNELAFIAIIARVWLIFAEVFACLSMLLLAYSVSLFAGQKKNI